MMPAVQVLSSFVARFRAARHMLQPPFVRRKADERHRHRILVIAHLDDVIGRQAVDHLETLHIVDKIRNPGEADACVVGWSVIKLRSHEHILPEATWNKPETSGVTGRSPFSGGW
jgi:hypothetical protein